MAKLVSYATIFEDKVNFNRRDFNRKKNIVKACDPYGKKNIKSFGMKNLILIRWFLLEFTLLIRQHLCMQNTSKQGKPLIVRILA